MNHYRLAIAYFSLFGGLLILSAQWLFALKIGLMPGDIAKYYLGSPQQFLPAKTVFGLLKSAVPHLAGMGLFIMVSGHFLLFTQWRGKRHLPLLLGMLYVSALLDVLLPFGIITGQAWLSVGKLAAFICFQILSLFLLVSLFEAAYSGIQDENAEKRTTDLFAKRSACVTEVTDNHQPLME